MGVLRRGLSTLVAIVIALAISVSIASAMYVYAEHLFRASYRPEVLVKCFDLGGSWICLAKVSTKALITVYVVDAEGHNVSKTVRSCTGCVEVFELSSRPVAAFVRIGSSTYSIPIYVGVVRWVG